MRGYIFRMLLCVALLAGVSAARAAEYVITYTSGGTTHYLENDNGSINDATTFNPSTCLWTCSGTTSGTLSNNGKYLYYSKSSLSLSTTSTTWTIDAGNNNRITCSGTKSGTRYIYYSSGWKASDTSSNLASGYSVTTTSKEATSWLKIEQVADNGFTTVGGTRDYSVASLYYQPAHKKYSWTAGTWYASTDGSYVAADTVVAVTAATSYSWTSDYPSNVTVTADASDSSKATATYATKFSADTEVSLTATATIPQSSSSFMTADATVSGTTKATLLSREIASVTAHVDKNSIYINETATVSLTTAHDGTPTYTVSDESIATVSADGTITAKGTGTGSPDEAEVTVTVSLPQTANYEAASAKVTVIVKKRPSSLAFSYSESNIYYGDATPTLSQCDVSDGINGNAVKDAKIYFSCSTTHLHADNATGALTIVGAGTTTVTASFAGDDTYSGCEAKFTLTVNKAKTTLSFPSDSYAVLFTEGFPDAPAATLSPAEAGTVTYSCTSDPDGLVTVDASSGAVAINGTTPTAGTATITATFSGNDNYEAATASYALTVSSRVEPNFSVTMDTDLYVDAKSTIQVDKGGSSGAVTYSSSDATVLTVSDSGVMTAVGEGTANVTITMEGDATYTPMTATFPVNVKRYPTQLTLKYLSSTYYTDHTVSITPNVSLIETVNHNGVDGQSYTFTSSHPNVLTVDASTGIVTIVGEGKSTVTATFYGTTKYEAAKGTFQITIVRTAKAGDFIRLKDASGNYVGSDGSTISTDNATADASNIIYYGKDRSLLFYQCGRYINDAALSLAAVVDAGTSGKAFTLTRDGDSYTISDGTTTMTSGGSDVWTVEVVDHLPLTFKSAGHGYSTMFCPVDLRSPAGVTAYYPVERKADDSGTVDYVITMEEVPHGVMPANTPLVLFTRDISTSYDFYIIDETQTLDNLWDGMTGTLPAINTSSAYSGTQWPYTLQPTSGATDCGFYPWKSDKHDTIEAFRCYIPGASAAQASAFRMVFDDSATGISTVTESAVTADSTIYNLQGMAVGTNLKALPAGVYIKDGKKVVVK